jgi:hypothetical protein
MDNTNISQTNWTDLIQDLKSNSEIIKIEDNQCLTFNYQSKINIDITWSHKSNKLKIYNIELEEKILSNMLVDNLEKYKYLLLNWPNEDYLYLLGLSIESNKITVEILKDPNLKTSELSIINEAHL